MLSLFASLFAIAHAQPAAAAPRDKQKADKHVKYEFMGQHHSGTGRERDTGSPTRAPRSHSTAAHRLHPPLLLGRCVCLTAGPPGTLFDLHCQRCWLSRLIETES